MGLETALPTDAMLTTQLQRVINWARRSSLWPLPFATACCGIELMATASSRYDLASLGAEGMRFSPRQSDLLRLAGRTGTKTLPVLPPVPAQMPQTTRVRSMAACGDNRDDGGWPLSRVGLFRALYGVRANASGGWRIPGWWVR